MKEDTAANVETKFKALKKAFNSGKTRDAEWRKNQLNQLILGIEESSDKICEGIMKDLKREEFTTLFLELGGIIDEIKAIIKHLDQWMKPEKIDTPLKLAPAKSRIVYQPLGAVWVIGAWNFPYSTGLRPFINAMAAGNTILLKPSEMSPASSAVLRYLIEKYLDNECFKVAEGGAEVSIACTQKKWDLLCFTGSSEKGKLVAQAAAKNLTPVILELGGKSITIVDESANPKVAALKIVSTRMFSSGQVCISPDYVMVHESLKKEFLKHAVYYVTDMFGDNPQTNKFFGRMVNEFHTQRVLDLATKSGGKILCGGKADIKDKYMEPTIIEDPKMDSAVMTEEIFGPVLPVISFKDIEDVYEHMNEREKPLAMYYFGKVNNNPNKDHLEKWGQAGGMAVNDCMIHTANPELPFGGVGYSGQGKYGGHSGFKHFSNAKSVIVKPTIDIESINKLIIPPYS